MFIIVTPEVLPVTGLLQIVLIKIFFSQPFGNRGNGIIAIGVFHGAVSGTRNAVGDVAQLQVMGQATASFRFMAVAGTDGCVFQHGLQAEFIIYSFQAFYEGVGYYDLSIGTALCASVAVATPGIRHVTVSFVDVDE